MGDGMGETAGLRAPAGDAEERRWPAGGFGGGREGRRGMGLRRFFTATERHGRASRLRRVARLDCGRRSSAEAADGAWARWGRLERTHASRHGSLHGRIEAGGWWRAWAEKRGGARAPAVAPAGEAWLASCRRRWGDGSGGEEGRCRGQSVAALSGGAPVVLHDDGEADGRRRWLAGAATGRSRGGNGTEKRKGWLGHVGP